MEKLHEFKHELNYARNLEFEEAWESFYQDYFKDKGVLNVVTVSATSDLARKGVNRIVVCQKGEEILVDEKRRRKDYGDFLIEEWSIADYDWNSGKVVRGRKVGWTLDEDRPATYIAYAIPSANRIYMVPFPLLRQTCKYHMSRTWKERKRIPAKYQGYTTINISVSWQELQSRMAEMIGVDLGGKESVTFQSSTHGLQLTLF